MAKTTKASSKKTPGKKKRPAKPAYLREIQIRYRKKRVKNGSPVGRKIAGAQQVYELFLDLQNESKEKLIAISLDIKLKIICFEVVAIGSLHTIYTRPFETLRGAIPMNAYGLILVHNHPSGDVTPGDADIEFTKGVMKITNPGGMAFHDHIIIGDGEYYSFQEKGLMAKIDAELRKYEAAWHRERK